LAAVHSGIWKGRETRYFILPIEIYRSSNLDLENLRGPNNASKVKEKRENISLRKLRKPGEREKQKVVLLFSST
jgi:hypothetical protein